jgi:hypothetical protein
MERNKLFYTGDLPIIGELSIKCSHRGGTASLCGFAEFTNPSTPPVYYLTATGSGSWRRTLYSDGGCSIIAACDGNDYSGTLDYDPTTCILTDNGQRTILQGGCPPSITSVQPLLPAFPPSTFLFPNNGSFVIESNQTVESGIGTDTCTVADGNPSDHAIITGSVTFTLSNPDTESNAINRLLAGSDGIWSTFVDSQSGGCCQAWWESRSSDSFNYKEIRFNIIGSGFTIGHIYMIPVEIYRSIYSSTPSFTLYSTRYYTISPDISGNISFIDTVPNTEGFITYATVNNTLSLSSCGPFYSPPLG